MVNSIEMISANSVRTIAIRWPVTIACLLLACLLCAAPVHSAGDHSRTHALLINGGGSSRINYQSHLLHVKRIYRILNEAGVPASNISILSADGSDPAPDLATREVQKEDRFWMLAGTRLAKFLRPPINYTNSEIQAAVLQPATRDNLKQWFETAETELLPEDTLLLYVTDHGTRNEEDLSNNQITLWGKGENIGVEELRDLINKLHPSVKVITLMSQCFSGSFANLMYGQAGDEAPRRNFGGFFSSTADRPAYGCFPENRDKYNVGHSFRFFDALEVGSTFTDAHTSVLISDQTPDVPLRASDLYLKWVLNEVSESLGVEFDELVDQFLRKAWKDKKVWEPDIRLLDRLGEAFGYFSPRYFSELGQHSDTLSEVGNQLDDYETAWKRTLQSLNRANLDRFIEGRPDWSPKLTEDSLKRLKEIERAELTRALLIDLAEYTGKDSETAGRLKLLREKAEATRKASYRVKVREAVVLRMRFILISIAGRQYLTEDASDSQRQAYASLIETETFALNEEERPRNRVVEVEPFPSFDEELKLANAALPGWMGIQFRLVVPERRDKYQLEGGAVSVLAVFPDSPAQQTGLEAGDIIIGPPGKPFTERDLVREWVMTAPIGVTQSLEVQRGSNRIALALTPAPYPREWPSLPGPPELGSQAPLLSEIEAFRGRPPEELMEEGPYLLFFWATWCGPCKAALPELLAFESERNIPVLSITDETAESVGVFLQNHNSPFPEAVALDEYRRSFLAYGVSATPSFVLVDAQGKIQSINSGYRVSQGLMFEKWTWQERQSASEE
jgi:thiol-disulfide isomerase/thioredoxin